MSALTPEQRHLRLKEIEPVKAAMMKAHARAMDDAAPLTLHTYVGSEHQHDLAHAMRQISIDDARLSQLMTDFLDACTSANELWLTTSNEVADRSPSMNDTIRAKYRADGGAELVTKIDGLYKELSRRLEAVLA